MKKHVKAALRGLKYKFKRQQPAIFNFHALLETFLRNHGSLRFIQVGGGDGKSFDPINSFVKRHPTKVEGYILEPIGYLFDELCREYKNIGAITPIRKAIHVSRNTMTMFRVDVERPGLGRWVKGVSSFDREHHRKTGIDESLIIEEEVDCISMPDLYRKYGIESLDLLVVDAEGYDLEILKTAELDRVRPSIIRFEHEVASGVMSAEDLAWTMRWLGKFGYQTMLDDQDATCYDPEKVFPTLFASLSKH